MSGEPSSGTPSPLKYRKRTLPATERPFLQMTQTARVLNSIRSGNTLIKTGYVKSLLVDAKGKKTKELHREDGMATSVEIRGGHLFFVCILLLYIFFFFFLTTKQ